MAARATPQALEVLGTLRALQPQPTLCSSCIWVTRGRPPPAAATHAWPWPGCVRSRASLPCCRMLREGKLMGW